MEITLPNSQGNQSFRSVAGKRSNGRAVYLGDPRLALLGRSPVGAEKSTLTTPCPVAAGSVFSGKVHACIQSSVTARTRFRSCTDSERLHSGRGGVAESKIQPLLRDQCLAGQFGPYTRTCERYHGLFSPGSRPTGSSQTLSASPTGLRASWGVRAHGAWGHESVRTTLVMGSFQVRCGPPGRSEERNGRQGGWACRWPQVFHTQAIRIASHDLFQPRF